ncbi:hypothetical protein KZX47_11720 [Thermus sp. SYSU G05001]|uniref:Uncharacterized protein n=1 Tax=Thermus brevis TaxID=2862456 RepID=A0ABS7A0H8_9DEIN|nr:hypothetical protein [Thermus brevis]MBW6395812.1 hypothetical protein [Thermus brevis]
MKRQKLKYLKEVARQRFANFQVYQEPDGPGWIAHGIHREHRTLWTARGSTEREALEILLGFAQPKVEVPS